MRCFVVVLSLVACASTAAAAVATCALAEEFFLRHNISADDSDGPGPICAGQCCGRGREAQVRSMVRRTAVTHAVNTTRRVADLLLSTRRTLQEHLTALSHQSQNKTAMLFLQLYRGQATRAHAPIAALYDDIRTLLRSNERDVTEDLGSQPPKDLAESARKFFRDVFPLAYQRLEDAKQKQFTPEYEACLKDAYDDVQPFGGIPQELGATLARSLEAARALLQVLAMGASALTASERVLSAVNEECANKLLRAGGCARCKGHEAKPCRNYCLNVARGCIGSLVAELNKPWTGYVESVERLARSDADAALRGLEPKVSEAYIYALENHVMMEKKVRHECGVPATVDVSDTTSPGPTPGAARRDALRAPPPDTELLQFAASLASEKKLFAAIADRLCDEPDFAEDGNEQCWNGESVGTYTKSLVASSSLNDQKYNPEVTGGAPQDPAVAALGDKLRHAVQLLVSHSWDGGAPAAEAFMQGDEAGDVGSGSGSNYPDDDAAYDAEAGSGEEGSGLSEINEKTNIGQETIYTSTPKTSSAASLPILPITIITALAMFT